MLWGETAKGRYKSITAIQPGNKYPPKSSFIYRNLDLIKKDHAITAGSFNGISIKQDRHESGVVPYRAFMSVFFGRAGNFCGKDCRFF